MPEPKAHASIPPDGTQTPAGAKAAVMTSTGAERSTSLAFTIVIPALNEEETIASTLERTLAARSAILAQTPITRVDIVLVSDGSTDRTVDIAEQFSDITIVVFRDAQGRPQNRGYGAAIKAGWATLAGDLLGFMDADGTCDPCSFIPMIHSLLQRRLDVVLGSRLGPASKMPRLRRIGNVLFAMLLGFLPRQHVNDTASGMRIVRRSSLPLLLPLPNGMHFTPALSARALLDDRLRIDEIPMAYFDRVGHSKLRVLSDGVAFLAAILSVALYLRPSRITIPLCALAALAMLILLTPPTAQYLSEHRIEEWMIYRLLLASFLGNILLSLFSATILAEQTIALSQGRHQATAPLQGARWYWLTRWPMLVGVVVLATMAGLLVGPGIVQYLSTTHVTLHWSRVVLASLVLFLLVQLVVNATLGRIISALAEQQSHWFEGLFGGASSIPTSDSSPEVKDRSAEENVIRG